MHERWQRIEELYHGALAQPADRMDDYLREMCGGDEALHREVRKLLDYDAKAAGFMEQSVMAGVHDPSSTQTMAAVVTEQRVGPYNLAFRLGVGGMGEVYLATDSRLGRRVALKLLLPQMSSHPDARARFLREARSAAALNHPNIATIFDAGESEGRLYLAMEYVDGKPLRALLDAGPLPEAEALDYAIQLASGLDHAHTRGILHRDIKPENVLVDGAGVVKLVDFGIAKALPMSADASPSITSPGVFVGTLKYAPPEVLAGRPGDRQSDIYSFGVMLHEMAGGQTLFERLPVMAAAAAALRGERAAAPERNAGVSDGLAEVIERCTAPAPEDRFSSAADLRAALLAVQNSGGASSTTQAQAATIPALALLEFTNLSGDPSIDWLGVGIVETLEGELRKIPAVQVVSRGRIRQLIQGRHPNPEEPAALSKLGARLGARWIASGSFQRAGNRIRVSTKLFRVPTGETVPTEMVDGVWDNLFDVQDRVVAALVRALDVGAGAGGPSRLPPAEPQSLDAYEHYANGRRCLNEMGQGALAEAKQHFERALALDPRYALACSGLGTAYALTCIQTSSPEDMDRARHSLECAIDLDAELGEPYPWLCYIYCRRGEVEKALAAGERGVRFQPDLSLGHYFYGGVLIGAVECGLGSYQKGLDHVVEAVVLDPRMGGQWLVAALGALLVGQCEAAQRFAEGALQVESAPGAHYRFVGGLTFMGFAHSSRLAWDAARRCHRESIESMRSSEHVYRDLFTGLSACGLGEIELRARRPEEALTHFRHAWRIVKEKPRMVGNARLGIRAQAGMAACYADLAERDRAETHLAEASSRTAALDYSSWSLGLGLSQLHYSLASAQLRLGLAEEAVASLRHAIDTGFYDRLWFEQDPDWDSLRNRNDYRQLLERLRNMPPVTIDLSRLPGPNPSASTAETAPPS